ncbi:MAG: long-chain fatty acid--CoA ligase [Desulfobacterales bacterium]|nr:long-chain fatty acid--CoA ligase [Desulfobacterales bacterium]
MGELKDYRNIHEMLNETVQRRREHMAYRWFTAPGQTDEVSWKEFYAQVRRAARGLIALGVKKEDKITILSYSCYRWVLCDMASAVIGAQTVGIYHSLPAPDISYIVDHSDSVVAFAEDQSQLDKLFKIREQIPEVRKVILFSGVVPEDGWVIGFDEFMEMGEQIPEEKVDEMAAAVSADDVAGIVYTSGTTGVPKGSMLTHDNLTFTAQSVAGSVVWYPDDQVFLFLPLAHVFARTCVYTSLFAGTTMTFCRGIDFIAEDIKAARPHWFPSVPRIYEKVHAKVTGMAEAKGGTALKIFNWAFSVGHEVGDLKLAKKPIPFLLGLKQRLANKLVLSKIQEALGGRVRWCISGAAPFNPDIGKWFHAAGVLVVEGIGMTENTSFSNLNRFDDYRFGWVGPPGPGIEQKTADDGEILFRGRNVMKGYYKMPEETAEVITEDGWLKTGDVGEIDESNFLRITGRKKEIIVTSGGKNIAPARIEGILATSRYINQVLVIGDERNYLTALVTIDPDNAAEYARQHGISFVSTEDLAANPAIVGMIEREVQEKNKELASFETVKKIRVVPEFTIDNGMLTPTMKVKKKVARKRYAEEIDSLYK